MSVDVDLVDDLHAAEDRFMEAASAAGALAEIAHDEAGEAYERLGDHDLSVEWRSCPAVVCRRAASVAAPYCRPSCGWRDDGVCDAEDPECCGCPCQHGEPDG